MTSTALERVAPSAGVVQFTPDQVDTLRTTLCSELDDNELQLFLAICQQQALDPFRKEIYATKTKRNKKIGNTWHEEWILTPIASIDAFRSKAQESGQYAGQRPPQWTKDGATWVDVWLEQTPPAACRVSVLRHDWSEPLTVVYTWREYTGGKPSTMQNKMPAHMLAKATEALALRKAFPRILGGIYTTEEMAGVPKTQPAEIESSETAAAEQPKRQGTVRRQSPAPAAESTPEATPAEEPEAPALVDADTFARVIGYVQQLSADQQPELRGFAAANGITGWRPDTMTVAMAETAEAKLREMLDLDVEDAGEAELVEPEPGQPADDLADLAAAVDAAQTALTTSSRRRSPSPAGVA